MDVSEMVLMDSEELKTAVLKELGARLEQKINDLEFDLIFNGTNNAADETLEFFELQRTYPRS